MLFGKQIAKQLSHPRGWMGRWIAGKMNQANADLYAHVFNQLKLPSATSVLEIGFANGHFLEKMSHLTDARLSGIEISDTMMRKGESHLGHLIQSGRLDLRKTGAETIPYENESFDRVISINTVYFWPNPELYLKEIHRVIAIGGLLSLGFREKRKMVEQTWLGERFRLYSVKDLQNLMEQAGFSDCRALPDPAGDQFDVALTCSKMEP